jgi:hypothetical protein
MRGCHQQWRILLLIVFAVPASNVAAAPGWSLFTEVHSNSFSEPLPIIEIVNGDLEGDLRGGSEFAYTHDVARVGASRGPWRASLFYRYDYYLDFDPDTAEVQYRRKNDLAIETDRDYDIFLDAIHAQMVGISVARMFELHRRLQLRTQVSVMRASDLTDGTITGTARVEADDSVTGTADVSYAYSRDVIFDRPDVEAPKAWGASLDLYLSWDISDSVGVHFFAEDLLNRLEWEDAPYTTASASSDTTHLDENGLLDVSPVLSGTEGYKNFSQQLPQRYQIVLEYQPTSRIALDIQFDRIRDHDFYRINSRFALSDNWGLEFAVDFTRSALGFGGSYRGLEFFLLSDDTSFRDARALEVRFSLEIPL